MERSQKISFIYPLPTLSTPIPAIPITTEESTGCNNEGATGANKAPRNSPSGFLLFHVLLYK